MTTNPEFDYFDIEKLQEFLATCCNLYENTAPLVHGYCDDLYQRLIDGKPIQLYELLRIRGLLENHIWETPEAATNRVYRLKHDLGHDLTGALDH